MGEVLSDVKYIESKLYLQQKNIITYMHKYEYVHIILIFYFLCYKLIFLYKFRTYVRQNVPKMLIKQYLYTS